MSKTREAIIGAAEVLFAQNGFAATSLRDITKQAGVNIAAVNYHFGSKEQLLIEILDRVVLPINVERLALLDEAEAAHPPDVEEIMTAFLLPDVRAIVELRERDGTLPRFVARMYSEGSDLMSRVMGRQFAETQRRFFSAFGAALPELSADEISWRLHCIVGIVVYLFAGVGSPGSPEMVGDDVDAGLRRLLAVTVPMMTSPTREGAVAKH